MTNKEVHPTSADAESRTTIAAKQYKSYTPVTAANLMSVLRTLQKPPYNDWFSASNLVLELLWHLIADNTKAEQEYYKKYASTQ